MVAIDVPRESISVDEVQEADKEEESQLWLSLSAIPERMVKGCGYKHIPVDMLYRRLRLHNTEPVEINAIVLDYIEIRDPSVHNYGALWVPCGMGDLVPVTNGLVVCEMSFSELLEMAREEGWVPDQS